MRQLFHDDGSWNELQQEWSKQCHDAGEDFESYMSATMPMLAEQIELCEKEKWSGVFASPAADGSHDAICFLNGAFIPDFKGRVLRVRHLILAPKYDYDDSIEEDYAKLLSRIFENVLTISDSELKCDHVKFHFRSPADVRLFRKFAEFLNEKSHFSSVKMVGAWLFVSKS